MQQTNTTYNSDTFGTWCLRSSVYLSATLVQYWRYANSAHCIFAKVVRTSEYITETIDLNDTDVNVIIALNMLTASPKRRFKKFRNDQE